MLNTDEACHENSVNPDQLTSEKPADQIHIVLQNEEECSSSNYQNDRAFSTFPVILGFLITVFSLYRAPLIMNYSQADKQHICLY